MKKNLSSSHKPSCLFGNWKLEIGHSTKGFTLVEMLVAVGIFAVIMVMSVGSLISLMDANHKAQTLKTVVNNLHFALENMSRNIRTGHAYHCGASTGALGQPHDCATASDTSLAFTSRTGSLVIYQWNANNQSIERSLDGGESYVSITAPEIQVQQLRFYVDGSCKKASSDPTCPSDSKQPRVLIVAKGFMKSKGKSDSDFTIETVVSQRQLDI